MFDALRRALLAITARGNTREVVNNGRRLAIGLIKAAAKGELRSTIEGIAAMAEIHETESRSLAGPEAVAAGQGGRFDSCDLRVWLTLAARAGVPFIPAHEILRLTEREMDAVSGEIEISPLLRRRLSKAAKTLADEAGIDADGAAPETPADRETVVDKLFDAMDDVPDNWMVRHVRCGPSTLKALAGCGVAGDGTPEVRFSADLEVGPGWVRTGNRRRVDVSDLRILKAYAEGPSGDSVYVARPWVKASRWAVGPDPHRHGSPFAGKGAWPAEWRAFVEQGEVIGVSSYYGWCGSATAENARVALAVRGLAQKIVDEARRQGAIPSNIDVEMLRGSEHFKDLDARFPRDAVACTLDFIETADGILLLEGGPAFTRVGGGHPCAFAGVERPEGVAFRIMPGVVLADPKTWRDGDRAGCVLSWDEAQALALQDGEPISASSPAL